MHMHAYDNQLLHLLWNVLFTNVHVIKCDLHAGTTPSVLPSVLAINKQEI
jgi:hypothetical protein